MVKRKIDLSPLAQEYLLEAIVQAQNELADLVLDLRTSLANRDNSTKSLEVIEVEPLDVTTKTRRPKRHKDATQKARAASLLPSATRESLIAWAQRHDGKLIAQHFVNTHRNKYNPNYLRAGMFAQLANMREQGIFKKTGKGRYALKASAEKALAATDTTEGS